jgi:GTPase
VAAAREGIDVLVLMVDAAETLANQGSGTQVHVDPMLIQRAKRFEGRTILALNKVDKAAKNKLLPMMEEFAKAHPFVAMVPISALKGDGCAELLGEAMKLLPQGEPYFPEDQVTDQPERFLASEIVREKAIALTYHEVPHALHVMVDKWDETPKLLRIQMTLTVERPSQKKILIGRKGDMLKKVGTQARNELEEILGTKIYLGLFVKVAENWRENPMAVRELDWHTQLAALGEQETGEE